MLYLFSGLSIGIQYVPCILATQRYFVKNYAMAISIICSGSSVGVFIFGYVLRYLIDLYAWRGALLLMSALTFHTVPLAMFLVRPIEGNYSIKESYSQDANSNIKVRDSCSDKSSKDSITYLLESLQKVLWNLLESRKDLTEPKFLLAFIAKILKVLEMGMLYVFLPLKLLSLVSKRLLQCSQRVMGQSRIVW